MKKEFIQIWFILTMVPTLLFMANVAYSLQGIADFDVALPNGYSLSRLAVGTFSINGPGNQRIITPRIDRYTVLGDYVLGFTVLDRNEPDSVEGYFLINTATGNVKKGLDRSIWTSELRKENLAEQPDMEKPPPTVWDAHFQGHNHSFRGSGWNPED